MTELYDALKEASDEALKHLETENREYLTEQLNRVRTKYHRKFVKIEHSVAPLTITAMLTMDEDTLRKLVMNTGFNGFLICWLMVNAINPEVIDELEKRDPDKFDVESGTWLE